MMALIPVGRAKQRNPVWLSQVRLSTAARMTGDLISILPRRDHGESHLVDLYDTSLRVPLFFLGCSDQHLYSAHIQVQVSLAIP